MAFATLKHRMTGPEQLHDRHDIQKARFGHFSKVSEEVTGRSWVSLGSFRGPAEPSEALVSIRELLEVSYGALGDAKGFPGGSLGELLGGPWAPWGAMSSPKRVLGSP